MIAGKDDDGECVLILKLNQYGEKIFTSRNKYDNHLTTEKHEFYFWPYGDITPEIWCIQKVSHFQFYYIHDGCYYDF